MTLNEKQRENILKVIPFYKNYLDSPESIEDIKEKNEKIQLCKEILSPDYINEMTEIDFGRLVSSLWSYTMWGNKGYLVDDLLHDNPLNEFKPKLKALLWSDNNIIDRYNTFKNSTRSFGSSTITEILAFTHPGEFGIWNKKTRTAISILGITETNSTLKIHQINGNQYNTINKLLCEICDFLSANGGKELDLLGINYFLSSIQNVEFLSENKQIAIFQEQPIDLADFDHDEAIDQLLEIGQWLGFEVEKEKLIATGARVDAIWQARVANLGVVTYVFEVQRRGNVDGLILNLQRAQNNPTVQRLIVVGLESELDRVKGEVNSLREDFRRMVGYMSVNELFQASDLVTELSRIINKLELVKSEFNV